MKSSPLASGEAEIPRWGQARRSPPPLGLGEAETSSGGRSNVVPMALGSDGAGASLWSRPKPWYQLSLLVGLGLVLAIFTPHHGP